MEHIKLIEGKFRIEILDRFNRDIDIAYHESVKKDMTNVALIRSFVQDSYDIFHALCLPVFLKKGKKYLLVARYWILDYLIDKRIPAFPAIVFDDKELIPDVLSLEELENSFFAGKKVPLRTIETKSKKKPGTASRATISREKAREEGRTCPFCNGPLAKSIGKDRSSKEGSHKVTCGYKSNKRYKCLFIANLTDREYEDYKSGELRTEQWLEPLHGKKCPECQDQAYLRTVMDNDGTIKKYRRCRKVHQSKNRTCTWNELAAQ